MWAVHNKFRHDPGESIIEFDIISIVLGNSSRNLIISTKVIEKWEEGREGGRKGGKTEKERGGR